MSTRPRALFTLRAVDVMSRDVHAIPQEMSLQAAAHVLAQDHISGAPVVDGDGRCVGVLSSTDFVHWAEKGDRPRAARREPEPRFNSEWEVGTLEALPRDEVRGYMTPDPVTAGPLTGIKDLARMMLDAHIHRIIVVDPNRRPIGIVSSTDILAAIAGPSVTADETPTPVPEWSRS